MSNKNHPILGGYVLPGLPHPLLVPDQNPGWRRLRTAFEQVRAEIERSDADLLLIYSTMWPSIIGHQILSRPIAEWVHVDELFHDLGSIPYRFALDEAFAKAYCEAALARKLSCRTVDYQGFPIDTGSVTALKLINPENRIPAVITSSNVYADRAETVVFAKAAVDALEKTGKKAIAIVISTLSNRLTQTWIDPVEDKIHSLKDDEWNKKVLEFLSLGRLEDVAQLSRQIHKEARVKKVVSFKPFWWLSAAMGSHNYYQGTVFAYEAVHGTGSAVVGLQRSQVAARDLEFDEDSPDLFMGDRNVLAPTMDPFTDPNEAEGGA